MKKIYSLIIFFNLLSLPIIVTAESYQYHLSKAKYFKEKNDFNNAAIEYKKALEASKKNDTEIMINIATMYRYLRKYNEAEVWLNKALKIDPNNKEALEDLESLKLKRGIHIMANYGGWEIDYTKNSRDLQIFTGVLPWADIYLGYSAYERLLYERSKISWKGYFFLKPSSYIKIEYNYKNYDYPLQKNPIPDDNAYDKMPSIEFEFYHSLSQNYSFSVFSERFTPSFYWDAETKASNYKIGTEFNANFLKILKASIFLQKIKDPDPTKLLVDHTNKKILQLSYKTDYFIGGGLDLNLYPLKAGFKYIPNRDLDNTLDYSYFIKIAYDIDSGRIGLPVNLRMDFLYDKYALISYMAGKSSKATIFTINVEPLKYLILNSGIKFLNRPGNNEVGFFIGFIYKYGI